MWDGLRGLRGAIKTFDGKCVEVPLGLLHTVEVSRTRGTARGLPARSPNVLVPLPQLDKVNEG